MSQSIPPLHRMKKSDRECLLNIYDLFKEGEFFFSDLPKYSISSQRLIWYQNMGLIRATGTVNGSQLKAWELTARGIKMVKEHLEKYPYKNILG
jgi:hypothetical protein